MVWNVETACSWKLRLRWELVLLFLGMIRGTHSRSTSSSYEDLIFRMPSKSMISWPQPATAYQIGRSLLLERSNDTEGGVKNVTYTRLVARSRIDPLNHFKRYRGGYDIKNKHYWASTVFTGVYGYAIASAWIIAGVLFGIYVTVKSCCCKMTMEGFCEFRSSQHYIWHFRLVIILNVIIIISSSFVLAGNSQFHTRAKRIESIIVGAAEEATATLYNVTFTLERIQDKLQPYDENYYMRLNRTAKVLNMAASDIHDKVYENKHAVDIGLRTLYIIIAVLVSINLALVIFGVAVILVHWRHIFTLIILICWILTTFSCFEFGFFIAIHTFAGDSCEALKEYQHCPYNTTLNSIIPCMDLKAADNSLAEVRVGVYVLIGELNRNISVLQTLPIDEVKGIPYICNPFSGAPNYEYRPDECPIDTIQIGDIPQLLEIFKCSGNDTKECNQGGKYITEGRFNEASAYSTSIQNLLDILPALQSLTNCSFVDNTFSRILNEQCNPLRKSVNMVWIGLLVLSIFMIALVISWIVNAFQYEGRNFSKGSVISQSTPANSPQKLILHKHTNAFKQMHYSQNRSASRQCMLQDIDIPASPSSTFQLHPT